MELAQLKSFMKAEWEDLTPAQEKEIEDWVVNELTTGEKTITKEEAHDAIVAFGKKHGFPPLPKKAWKKLEYYFDMADTNNDGQLDLAEVQAAVAHVEKHGVPEMVQIKNFLATQWEDLTPAQEKEIEDWVVNELTTGEKTI